MNSSFTYFVCYITFIYVNVSYITYHKYVKIAIIPYDLILFLAQLKVHLRIHTGKWNIRVA